MKRIVSFAVLLWLAGVAQAKDEKAVVQMDQSAPLSEQVQRVEDALRSEHYSEIPLEERSRAQQALGRIKLKMNGHEQVHELSPADRTAVFNDQQVVNTILTRGHEDSRMVCRRERATGSNFPQNVCMTVAQRRKAEAAGRALLNDTQRGNNYGR